MKTTTNRTANRNAIKMLLAMIDMQRKAFTRATPDQHGRILAEIAGMEARLIDLGWEG